MFTSRANRAVGLRVAAQAVYMRGRSTSQRRMEALHGGFVRGRTDPDLLVFVVAMSVVLGALLVIISRMPSDNPLKRDLGRAQLSRRRDGGGGNAGHSGDSDPGSRRRRRFRGAARSPLVLVDLLPRRAPRPARETCAMKFLESQRPRHPHSQSGAARRAAARLHQSARDRLPDLERGRRNPRGRFSYRH
jgi:hypothetical protein